MRQRNRAWMAGLFGVMMLLGATPARGAGRHYALIFGAQSSPKKPRLTHSWTTFVRVVGEGNDPSNIQVFQHTISWYPASLVVRPWSLVPEDGVNLDLPETLDLILGKGEDVTMWGPFAISPELYRNSLQEKAFLDSGGSRYRTVGAIHNLHLNDCTQAIAGIDPVFGGTHSPLIRIGYPASRYFARRVVTRGDFDQARVDASWLIPWMGLDRFPIEFVPPARIPDRMCVLCRCPE